MSSIPVLVVGAGPSGLNLALALTRRNVPCRVISEADGPGMESRAMVVQARTLEFYGQYGFAAEVIRQGVIAETAHVRKGGPSGSREVLSISFEEMGAGLSPYPFALAYPQDDHERFLINKLKEVGCEVEWNAKLTGFVERENAVTATIEHKASPIEEVEAVYIGGVMARVAACGKLSKSVFQEALTTNFFSSRTYRSPPASLATCTSTSANAFLA